jgi:hypothetical protein
MLNLVLLLKICKNCGNPFDNTEDDYCCLECKENHNWILEKK